jgi:hypothetical protein
MRPVENPDPEFRPNGSVIGRLDLTFGSEFAAE